VLKLAVAEATILACHASQRTLNDWTAPPGYVAARIARDELWVVGPRAERGKMISELPRSLAATDPGALAVDQTDGWTIWLLSGAGAREALARLTVVPLPGEDEGTRFLQGAVAGVPGKLLLNETGIFVFVPAPVGDHLLDRVTSACADLSPEVGLPVAFAEVGQLVGFVGEA